MIRQKQPATLISLLPEHFEEAATLAATIYNRPVEEATRAIWQWKLLDNPASKLNEDLGWAIRNEDGQLGGLLVNVPQEMWVKGEVVLACAGSAYAVDVRYRQQGLTLAHAFVHQKKPFLLLNTTANKEARTIFRYMGFRALPSSEEAFFWALRPLPLAVSALLRRTRTPKLKRLLTGLSSIPIISGLSFKWGWPIRPQGIRVEPITEIGVEFDHLWDRLKGEHSVTAVRTAEVLSWRFHSHPRKERRCNVLGARDIHGQLLGYVAWRRFDIPQIALKRAVIVDLFAPEGRSDVIDELFVGALLGAKENGAYVLECRWFSTGLRRHLLELGVLRRRKNSGGYLFRWKHSAKDLGAVNWYPSGIDGDSSMS